MLLPDLKNIEHVMLEKYNKKLKAKVKASTARSDRKSKPKKGKSGGGSCDQVQKKACTEKFWQPCKTHVAHTRCIKQATVVTKIRKVSLLAQAQVSPLTERSPTRSLGVIRA